MRAGDYGQAKDHGFVFEVDPSNPSNDRDPVPLAAMGRFPHEAVAVDPGTSKGAFWSDGRAYIVCSFSEGTHAGQVWSYHPASRTLRLEVFLAIGDPDRPGDSPDNICVSPDGGLILAEDGDGMQYLLAVDDDGGTTAFARNARDDTEFTCVFSPAGKTLFANIQEPGVTFAIKGHSRGLGAGSTVPGASPPRRWAR